MKKILLFVFLLLFVCSSFGTTSKVSQEIYGINFFNSQYGIIYTQNGNGIIDKNGNLVWKLEKKLDITYLWDDYFLISEINDKYKVVNINNKKIVTFPQNTHMQVSEGYSYIDFKEKRSLIANVGNKFYIYNEKMEIILDIEGNEIQYLSNGNFLLSQDSKSILYDKNGKKIKSFPYSYLTHEIYNNIYILKEDGSSYYLLDEKGDLIDNINFDEIIEIKKDYAIVIKDEKYFIYNLKKKSLKEIYSNFYNYDFFGDRIKNNIIVADTEIYNVNSEVIFNNKEKLNFIYNKGSFIAGENEHYIVIFNNKFQELKRLNKKDYEDISIKKHSPQDECYAPEYNVYYIYTDYMYQITKKNEYQILREDGNGIKTEKRLYSQNVKGYITNGHTLWNPEGKIVFSDNKAVIQTITSFKDSDYTSVVKNNQIGILDKEGNVKWIGKYIKKNNDYDVEKRLKNQEGL